jgi:hypothetical protein
MGQIHPQAPHRCPMKTLVVTLISRLASISDYAIFPGRLVAWVMLVRSFFPLSPLDLASFFHEHPAIKITARVMDKHPRKNSRHILLMFGVSLSGQRTAGRLGGV